MKHSLLAAVTLIFAAYPMTTQSTDINSLFNEAYAATTQGDITTAVTAYNAILSINPQHAQTHYNLGYILKMAGEIEEAIKEYQIALSLCPGWAQAQFALSTALLHEGNLQAGWEHYCQEHLAIGHIKAEKIRLWTHNNELKGKHILLQHQGGFGDTFQFIRYAQELKQRGAYLTLFVPKSLKPLLTICPYLDHVITTGDPVPAYDDSISTMCLPLLFPEYGNRVPTNIPYLFPDTQLVADWKKFFEQENQQHILKIGLCWTADLKNDESRPPVAHRSISLEQLQPLSTLHNIHFYSLQKDPTGLSSAPYIKTYDTPWDEEHGAFMDTAAIMQHLDLVITVDTSVAHVAGALGVRVWLLLPFSVDWRWTAHRTDSIWYPSMRIFKQKKPMNWAPVINDVMNALQEELLA